MHSLPLFILATFCYTAPFIFPHYCSLLIFFFPGLLFLILTRHNPSKKSLFYWSIAITMLHLVAICDALLCMASGGLMLRILPPFALIIYVTLYPMAWLLIMRFLLQKKWCQSFTRQLTWWTISLWFYLLIIDQALLWIFGRCEGYIFMNPFLPLAVWPSLIVFSAFVPSCCALAWFCLTSSLITAVFLKPTKKNSFFLILNLLPWLLGIAIPLRKNIPPWHANVGHLPLLLPHSIEFQMGNMLLYEEFDRLHHIYPSVTTVILPESAWNGEALSSITHLPFVHPAIKNIVIGGFAQQPNGYFNRIYSFIDGNLMYRYDKRHAVPLTERKSSYSSNLAHTLFFQKSPPITPSKIPKTSLELPGIGSFIPYICSELFCNTHPDDPFNLPILFLVNDWWFRMPHFQKLMALAARLQAIRWHRSILYISFHYAQFFDEFGFATPLATTRLDRYIA